MIGMTVVCVCVFVTLKFALKLLVWKLEIMSFKHFIVKFPCLQNLCFRWLLSNQSSCACCVTAERQSGVGALEQHTFFSWFLLLLFVCLDEAHNILHSFHNIFYSLS